MNVTFLIGNGFDLRLGLKTRYTDMYKGYINSPTNDKVIADFKEILRSDSIKNYQTWGDFEMAMARHAKNFKTEKDFISCVRDFKKYMSSYLKQEEQVLLNDLKNFPDIFTSFNNETYASLTKFYTNGLTPNVINQIKQIERKSNAVYYRFINFNYTKTLDALLEEYMKRHIHIQNPIHIHGDLKDAVLGVNDIFQLGELPYSVSLRLKRAFIKPEFNKMFDDSRVQDAITLIEFSDVICTYGMSLGDSDAMWKDKIFEWLFGSENHHWFHFMYKEGNYSGLNGDELMDEEDDRKSELLSRFCKTDEEINRIYDQVHIPVGHDIFGYQKLWKQQKKVFDVEKVPAIV